MSDVHNRAAQVLAPTDQDIGLDLPADVRHLPTVRVLTASLAAEAGMTVRELDDLRLAVDELVTLLVEAADGQGALRLTFRVAEDGLDVLGRLAEGSIRPMVDDLSARILDAVIDTHDAGPGWMSLHKATSRGLADDRAGARS